MQTREMLSTENAASNSLRNLQQLMNQTPTPAQDIVMPPSINIENMTLEVVDRFMY